MQGHCAWLLLTINCFMWISSMIFYIGKYKQCRMKKATFDWKVQIQIFLSWSVLWCELSFTWSARDYLRGWVFFRTEWGNTLIWYVILILLLFFQIWRNISIPYTISPSTLTVKLWHFYCKTLKQKNSSKTFDITWFLISILNLNQI